MLRCIAFFAIAALFLGSDPAFAKKTPKKPSTEAGGEKDVAEGDKYSGKKKPKKLSGDLSGAKEAKENPFKKDRARQPETKQEEARRLVQEQARQEKERPQRGPEARSVQEVEPVQEREEHLPAAQWQRERPHGPAAAGGGEQRRRRIARLIARCRQGRTCWRVSPSPPPTLRRSRCRREARAPRPRA